MSAGIRTTSKKSSSLAVLGSSRSMRAKVHLFLGCAIVAGTCISFTPSAAQDTNSPPIETTPGDVSPAPVLISVDSSENVAPDAFLKGAAALPDAEIEAWLASPTLNFPGNLGGSIVNYIVRLAGSDSRAVLALIKLAEADEAPLPINQISRGLARSRNSASEVAIEYASFMDERVANSSSQRLIEAYQAALQEGTAAISPGAVGAGPDGGSLSGNTNVGGGSGDGTGDGTVATRGFDTVLSASYSGIFSSDGSPAD